MYYFSSSSANIYVSSSLIMYVGMLEPNPSAPRLLEHYVPNILHIRDGSIPANGQNSRSIATYITRNGFTKKSKRKSMRLSLRDPRLPRRLPRVSWLFTKSIVLVPGNQKPMISRPSSKKFTTRVSRTRSPARATMVRQMVRQMGIRMI